MLRQSPENSLGTVESRKLNIMQRQTLFHRVVNPRIFKRDSFADFRRFCLISSLEVLDLEFISQTCRSK